MMEAGRRVKKFESEVQKIVSQYLVSRVQSELNAMVTVSRVHMPGDLKAATVFVTAIPFGDPSTKVNAKELLTILDEHRAGIQSEISHALRTKYCPRIKFALDSSLEKVLRVESLIRQVAVDGERFSTNLSQ